ncbi:MAG: DUF899 family protein [Caldilineaceae bacterium]
MQNQRVVSHEEWLRARRELLAQEKEFTRLRDRLSQQRRELPWEKVNKSYVFDGPDGQQTLAQLFGGRCQLVVYHFMFGPDWAEGCPRCSLEKGQRVKMYNYVPNDELSGELPGISVFYRDDSGAIFHTYFCYARGLDMLNTAYHYLDLVPKGRDEAKLEWPMAWVRRHDRYDPAATQVENS